MRWRDQFHHPSLVSPGGRTPGTLDFANAFLFPGVNSRRELVPRPELTPERRFAPFARRKIKAVAMVSKVTSQGFMGLHGNRTRDLSHPKRESYHQTSKPRTTPTKSNIFLRKYLKNNKNVIPSATVIKVSKFSLCSGPEMNWWFQTPFQILFQSLFALFVVFVYDRN